MKSAEEKPQIGDRRMIMVQRQLVAFIKVLGMKNKTTISTDLFDMIFEMSGEFQKNKRETAVYLED